MPGCGRATPAGRWHSTPATRTRPGRGTRDAEGTRLAAVSRLPPRPVPVAPARAVSDQRGPDRSAGGQGRGVGRGGVQAGVPGELLLQLTDHFRRSLGNLEHLLLPPAVTTAPGQHPAVVTKL